MKRPFIYLFLLPLVFLGACNQEEDPNQNNFKLGTFHPAQNCGEVESYVQTFSEQTRATPDQVIQVSMGNLTSNSPTTSAAEPTTSSTEEGSSDAGNTLDNSSVLQSDISFADTKRGLIYLFDHEQNLRVYRGNPSSAVALKSTLPLGFQPLEVVTLSVGLRHFAILFGGNFPSYPIIGVGPFPGEDIGTTSAVVYPEPEAPQSIMAVIDVTREEDPFEVKRELIPGYFLEARALPEKSSVVWVVHKGLSIMEPQLDLGEIFPKKDVTTAQGTSVIPVTSCDKIFLYENESLESTYAPASVNQTFISLIDLASPDQKVTTQALYSPAWNSTIAVNPQHLFLAQQVGNPERDQTELFLFDLNPSVVPSLIASGPVPGTIHNQFFIDEKEGYIRIFHHVTNFSWGSCPECFVGVTLEETDQESPPLMVEGTLQTGNYLSILQKEGSTLTKVSGVGPFETDEIPYSARFVGALGCVITFRQIDPLTCFDLSNPWEPKKTGELELAGVSHHLEAITDTLLLGIGQGGNNGSVVANLFDVSNPDQPRLAAQHLLSQGYGWSSSEVFYDYRALGKDDAGRNFVVPIDSEAGSLLALFTIDTVEKKILPLGNILKSHGPDVYYDPFRRAYFFEETLGTISYESLEVYLRSNLTKIFDSPLGN